MHSEAMLSSVSCLTILTCVRSWFSFLWKIALEPEWCLLNISNKNSLSFFFLPLLLKKGCIESSMYSAGEDLSGSAYLVTTVTRPLSLQAVGQSPLC